ncbi:PKD domain-containing protein [Desulfonema limicola]|uniref:PKD domain-containing protein n=1 Tax=Desulfonema limicola TaxID=45656 RepID=A0A975BC64_9BACT|nr:PKD domain-containing protein [Desulfonema limicola]QTA82656.1 PKD domain-containing protein [Desulfonema limicola]
MRKKVYFIILSALFILFNLGLFAYAADGDLMDGSFDATIETDGIPSNPNWTGNFKSEWKGTSCVSKDFPFLIEDPADSGNWMAYFYGEGFSCVETGLLEQSNILVKQNAKLKFKLRIIKTSFEIAAGTLYVRLIKNGITQGVEEYTQNNAGGWLDEEIDLSQYADEQTPQTLSFFFRVQKYDALEQDIAIYLDDIVLTSCDVEAGFTLPEPVTIGVPVTFTNTSTGAVVDTTASWLWDFDTANPGTKTSTDKDPQPVIFDEARTYNVKLTATGTDNCQTFAEQEITVNCDVKAALPEPVTVKVAQEYQFENLSTGTAVDNPATIWAWDVKNSSNASVFTSESKAPAYSFPSTGTYTINLTATSATGSGCLTTATQTVTVECDVDAAFTLPKTQVKVGEAFTVTNKSTGPAVDNNIAGWSWNFQENGQYGDGTSSTSKNPTFTYLISDTPKNIEIQLTATGTGGCTKLPAAQSIEIICDTSASFTSEDAGSTLTLYAGQQANFTNTSSPGYKSIEWFFGDTVNEIPKTNTGTVSHTYTSPGTYTFRIYAISESGCRTSAPPEGFDLTVIPAAGNINGDSSIDLKDAVTALQVTAGFEDLPDINKEYGDVNNDEKIGLEEAVYVLQKVSEMN